uniref:Uncharacterized protein n=1 Tax=Molossus molossus TaxID=27622 RepID=A0A7J8F9A4_MOLMO|nr:hypothetical protein HJG59_008615 [Molossus molossus]
MDLPICCPQIIHRTPQNWPQLAHLGFCPFLSIANVHPLRTAYVHILPAACIKMLAKLHYWWLRLHAPRPVFFFFFFLASNGLTNPLYVCLLVCLFKNLLWKLKFLFNNWNTFSHPHPRVLTNYVQGSRTRSTRLQTPSAPFTCLQCAHLAKAPSWLRTGHADWSRFKLGPPVPVDLAPNPPCSSRLQTTCLLCQLLLARFSQKGTRGRPGWRRRDFFPSASCLFSVSVNQSCFFIWAVAVGTFQKQPLNPVCSYSNTLFLKDPSRAAPP